uniref:Uncharacterized protein n=1 Tax=Ascaris lumbricoides TaxID=6252 RepID=A0A0M3IR59_ASCLU
MSSSPSRFHAHLPWRRRFPWVHFPSGHALTLVHQQHCPSNPLLQYHHRRSSDPKLHHKPPRPPLSPYFLLALPLHSFSCALYLLSLPR